MLEKAIHIAVNAHYGQVDKQGLPYILHPMSVMQKVRRAVGINEDYLIVAILHDVVEDCNITLEQLKEYGFSETVIEAIDSVTKREGESYPNFVLRSSKNRIGRVVKLADVTDNHDRIPQILDTKWWNKLNNKYAVAKAILEDNLIWLKNNDELVEALGGLNVY